MSDINTTAPTPTDRVGEDRVLVPRLLSERMRESLHGSVVIRCHLDKREASILNDQEWWEAVLASAPAPSDPAGAGGDLGEPSREAIEMMAEHLHEEGDHDRQWRWPEHADDDGYRGNGGYVTITPTDVQCRMREMARRVLVRANQITHRSGQLVASTPGQKGAEEVIKFAVGIDDHYDRLEFLQSWLSGDTSEWPEFIQTSPFPPSATPEGDPPMTAEEAKNVLGGIPDRPGAAEEWMRHYRGIAKRTHQEAREKVRSADHFGGIASRIELALRTLHAAGEVR